MHYPRESNNRATELTYSSKQNRQADPANPDVSASRSSTVPIAADEVLRLKSQIKRLRRYISELEQAADSDPLVSVYNRRAFIRELSRAQSVMGRYEIPSSIVHFNLNGFKDINDRFGQAMGDEMLKRVGRVLTSSVRGCDMVARLGGDEFGVLLFKTEQAEAISRAELLAGLISDIQIEFPTRNISVDARWDVIVCDQSKTADQILEQADTSLVGN